MAGTASSTTRSRSPRSPAPNAIQRPTRTWSAKAAERKTTKGALRSLKRHLARRFYQLLAEPLADQPHAANGRPITEPDAAMMLERRRPERATEQITTAPTPIVCLGQTARPTTPQRRSPARLSTVSDHRRRRRPQITAIPAHTDPPPPNDAFQAPLPPSTNRTRPVAPPDATDPPPLDTHPSTRHEPIPNAQIGNTA